MLPVRVVTTKFVIALAEVASLSAQVLALGRAVARAHMRFDCSAPSSKEPVFKASRAA